jgi:hypothetical protein
MGREKGHLSGWSRQVVARPGRINIAAMLEIDGQRPPVNDDQFLNVKVRWQIPSEWMPSIKARTMGRILLIAAESTWASQSGSGVPFRIATAPFSHPKIFGARPRSAS